MENYTISTMIFQELCVSISVKYMKGITFIMYKNIIISTQHLM